MMEKHLSTQHILPKTALRHCVIRVLSRLLQYIAFADSFIAQGIFIVQIILGTLLCALSSFSTFQKQTSPNQAEPSIDTGVEYQVLV